MSLLFKYIPAIAKQLAGTSVVKFCILTLQFWYFALSRKLQLSSSDFKIVGELYGNPIIFYLVHVMDIAVLREILVDKEYEWFPIEDPKVIVDLGAHFGDTALYYHARFPNAKILAVEPAPESFVRLQKHVAGIPQIIPVQAAVGPVDDTVVLNLVPSSLGHSLQKRKNSTESIEVLQVSLATLFKDHGIEKADLIKFDIEGAEFDIFMNSKPEDFAGAYIGELHLDLTTIDLNSFSNQFHAFKQDVKQVKNERFLFTAQRPI